MVACVFRFRQITQTPEGLARSRRATWKHGYYSTEAIQQRRMARAIAKSSKAFLEEMGEGRD